MGAWVSMDEYNIMERELGADVDALARVLLDMVRENYPTYQDGTMGASDRVGMAAMRLLGQFGWVDVVSDVDSAGFVLIRPAVAAMFDPDYGYDPYRLPGGVQ